MDYKASNENVDIKFSAHDTVSWIIFIRYTQNQKLGKGDNLKLFGAIKPNSLNRIATFGQGHLCTIEENLNFINIYIIWEP